MSLEERAREFASTDLQLNDALSGEDIVRLITDFAAPYEAALRELVEAARQFDDDDSCQYDHHGYCQTHGPGPIPCSMITLKQALSNAERLLKTDDEDESENPYHLTGGELDRAVAAKIAGESR